MFPTFTINDSEELCLANPVFPRERGTVSFRVSSANIKHVGIAQSGTPVLLASAHTLRVQPRPVPVAACGCFRMQIATVCAALRCSAFTHHIRRIVGVRTKEKVRRITARSIVAVMTDHEFAGVYSVVKEVRNSVRLISLPPDLKDAVLISLVAMPDPGPTLIRFSNLHLRPKQSGVLRRHIRKFTMRFSQGMFSYPRMCFGQARLSVSALLRVA
jgi:hypothetical protein